MAWLDVNPPRRSQFRRPRRAQVRPVFTGHTSESPWPSSNALGVARFIRDRTDPGSYHELSDADRLIDLIDLDAEAFHDGTGSNPWSYGGAAACRTIDWARMPADVRQRFLMHLAIGAARCNAHCVARTGRRIEARRITRAQSEAGVAGFIPHGDRDPKRRTDWGTTTSAPFPWAEFWPHYLRAIGHPTVAPTPPPLPAPPQEDPLMALTADQAAKLAADASIAAVTATAALDAAQRAERYAREAKAYARAVAEDREGQITDKHPHRIQRRAAALDKQWLDEAAAKAKG